MHMKWKSVSLVDHRTYIVRMYENSSSSKWHANEWMSVGELKLTLPCYTISCIYFGRLENVGSFV